MPATHDDALNDGDGMVVAKLTVSESDYNVTNGSAWVRIVDDDVPEVTLSVTKSLIIEGEAYEWHLTRNCCNENRLRLSTEESKLLVYPRRVREFVSSRVTRILPTEGSRVGFFQPGELRRVIAGDQRADIVGPLGGYFKYRILEFPEDNFEGIPEFSDRTFPPRYTVSSTDPVRIAILNSGPGVEIESKQDSVTEGDEMTFAVKRYGGPSDTIRDYAQRVRINVTQSGSYLPDSEIGQRTVTIPAGQTSVNLSLATVDDSEYRRNGEVTVTILEGANTDETEDAYDVVDSFSALLNRYLHKANVDVFDNEEPGVTIQPTSLTVREGGTSTYTVVLDTPPTDTVTVTPSFRQAFDSASLEISGALTFTASNWQTPQSVTVSARENSSLFDLIITIQHTVSGGDYASVTAEDVVVTIDDNDSPQVTLTLTPSSIAESDDPDTPGVVENRTLVTASLDYASGVAVVVDVSVEADLPATSSDYSLSANKVLRIEAGSTSSTGTVTLTATDNDVQSGDKTITVKGAASVTGTQNLLYDVGSPADVELTIADDDSRGVTLSKSLLGIDEGGEGSYTVVLDSEPTATVTVTPSRSSGDADVTVSGALTFTRSNWHTAQTVTVRSAQDDDADDDTAVIGHTVSGGDYASVSGGTVHVTVDDDESVSETKDKDDPVGMGPNNGEIGTCSLPSLSDIREFWSDTVTLEASGGGYGYVRGSAGSLTEVRTDDFTIGSTGYTVGRPLQQPDGALRFDVSPGLNAGQRANLTLHVCNQAYRLREASSKTSGTDDASYEWAGSLDWSLFDTRQVRLSAPVDRPMTGEVRIPLKVAVGEMMRLDTSDLHDPDGLSAAAFDYQWFRSRRDSSGPETTQTIAGATSPTYTPTRYDVDPQPDIESGPPRFTRYWVRVGVTDDFGVRSEKTSAETENVARYRACANNDWSGKHYLWENTVEVENTWRNAFREVEGWRGASPSFGRLLVDRTAMHDTYLSAAASVRGVWVGSSSTLNLLVSRAFTTEEAEGVILYICGREFRVSDATDATSSAYDGLNKRYAWTSTGLDWATDIVRVPAPEGTTQHLHRRVALAMERYPRIETVAVQGTNLSIVYSQALDESSVPAETAFTVTVGGSAVTVDSVDIEGRTVTLVLGSAVAEGASVSVSYTPPSSNVLKNTAGVKARAVSSRTARILSSGLNLTIMPPTDIEARLRGGGVELRLLPRLADQSQHSLARYDVAYRLVGRPTGRPRRRTSSRPQAGCRIGPST